MKTLRHRTAAARLPAKREPTQRISKPNGAPPLIRIDRVSGATPNKGTYLPTVDHARCEGKRDCVVVCPNDVFEVRRIDRSRLPALSSRGSPQGQGAQHGHCLHTERRQLPGVRALCGGVSRRCDHADPTRLTNPQQLESISPRTQPPSYSKPRSGAVSRARNGMPSLAAIASTVPPRSTIATNNAGTPPASITA